MTPDQLGRRVALLSMFVSASLATVKIIIGLKANSTAVVSDGVESAADVLASGLVLFGLLVASKPPDADHPYGHGRFEMLSALAVGVLLIASGTVICHGSIERAYQDTIPPKLFAIWPLMASIVIKSGTWSAKRHYGRKIGSDALVADSWHDVMDNLSAVTALGALALAVSHPQFASADRIGGFVVGLIVVFLGAHVVRNTTMQLMDTMPDRRLLQQIRESALSVPGALGVEKCYARKTGLKYHVDLHLEVDPAMTVQHSHSIAEQVRTKIRRDLDWVADVLVHVEPHPTATISDRKHG